MGLTNRTFNLCVVPSEFPPTVSLSQYDNDVECTAQLVDESGAVYNGLPSGCTAKVVGINRKLVPFDIVTIIDGSNITFTPYGAMTDCYGQQRVTLEITHSGLQFSPLEILFDIQKAGRTKEETAESREFKDAIEAKVAEYSDQLSAVAEAEKEAIREVASEETDNAENEIEAYADSVKADLDDYKDDVKDELDEYADNLSDHVDGLVANWINNNPDALTDQEITMVETFSQLKYTTAEEVIVKNDDGYYGSGERVTYMVARNLYDGEKQIMDGGYSTPYFAFLKRENGDYMVPKPRHGSVASPVPAVQIGKVIQSYFNHPELLYGSVGTAFTPPSSDPSRDPTQTPRIDCSAFASLVVQDICYENSRYVSGNDENIKGRYAGLNIPRNPRTSIGDGTNNKYNYGASELAMYYAEQNRLFYIDYDREHPASQLQIGDLIFYSHAFKKDSDSPDLRRRYLHIGHVAIVLDVYPESDTIMIAEVGTPQGERYFQPISRVVSGSDIHRDVNIATSKIFDFTDRPGVTDATGNPDDGWGDIVYARPIYPELEQEFTQILESADFYKDVASPSGAGNQNVLAALHFSKPLAPNKIYTLIAEGDLPNDPEQNDRLVIRYWATGTSGGAAIYQRINQLNKYGDKVSYVFVPPENIADMTNIYISVFRPSDSAAADSNVYNLKKIAVYEGICPGEPAVIDSGEIEVIYHHWDHVKNPEEDIVGDTSWIFIKLPRRLYKISFHNCSGNDEDNPEVKISNPKAWLESHADYFLAHNLAFSGVSAVSWGYRWNGSEAYPSTTEPLTYKRPRNFFAVDTETEEFAFYNSCTIPFSGETEGEQIASVQARYEEAGNVLRGIPAKYDTVFACGDWLVQNGTVRTADYTNDEGMYPRTCLGWDDEYYYVLSCEGRGTYERGLQLDEVKDIFVSNNVANAMVFDGGGSVCLAARIGGNVEKINRFRDCKNTYPILRKVGLCAAYGRRHE